MCAKIEDAMKSDNGQKRKSPSVVSTEGLFAELYLYEPKMLSYCSPDECCNRFGRPEGYSNNNKWRMTTN